MDKKMQERLSIQIDYQDQRMRKGWYPAQCLALKDISLMTMEGRKGNRVSYYRLPELLEEVTGIKCAVVTKRKTRPNLKPKQNGILVLPFRDLCKSTTRETKTGSLAHW